MCMALRSLLGLLLSEGLIVNLENTIIRLTVSDSCFYEVCMDDIFIICDESWDLNRIPHVPPESQS